MLKVYEMPDGHRFQFNEGEQPEEAVSVEQPKPKRTTSKTKKVEGE